MTHAVSLFLAAYAAVFVAELVGDKTLYTLAMLSTRFRAKAVVAGAALAFMVKMAVAVLFGRLLAGLSPLFVSVLSAATFCSLAIAFLIKARRQSLPKEETEPSAGRAFAFSFLAIFVPEWGDPGQLTAAMLVAQHDSPVLIWCSATLALFTKGVLSVVLGARLRAVVPENGMRFASALLFVALAVLAGLRVEL